MQTFLSDILHVVAQALLVPDIILLLALIVYALFSIGSVLVEYFTEHKHYEVVMPRLLSSLSDSDESLIPSIIEESGLLNRQKEALKTVFEYRTLPGDALIALVKRLMNEEEAHYEQITDRDNMAAKVAPMLGLMGTLIPLGPGIQALGQADTATLSSSLLVAFDTTVAGLVTAAVCLVIGKIRSTWYDNYLSALDSAMATMLQKVEDTRALQQSQQQYSQPQSFAQQPQPADAYQPTVDYGYGYADQSLQATPSGMPVDPTLDVSGMPLADPVDYLSSAEATGPIDPVAPATTPSGMPLDFDSDSSAGLGSVFEPARNPVDDDVFPN